MDDLVISRSLTVKDSELKERFSRSSGPGGQGVNTADSRVELSYDVANAAGIGPTIRARLLDRLATQARRRRAHDRGQRAPHPARQPPAARERLVEVLREAAAPPPRKRRPTKPTRGSKERRLAEKKRRGQTKQGRSGRWD